MVLPLLLLAGSLLLLVFLAYLGWLLWRWGHVILYALDYARIKLTVWWFVRQRYTVIDMFTVTTQHQHTVNPHQCRSLRPSSPSQHLPFTPLTPLPLVSCSPVPCPPFPSCRDAGV